MKRNLKLKHILISGIIISVPLSMILEVKATIKRGGSLFSRLGSSLRRASTRSTGVSANSIFGLSNVEVPKELERKAKKLILEGKIKDSSLEGVKLDITNGILESRYYFIESTGGDKHYRYVSTEKPKLKVIDGENVTVSYKDYAGDEREVTTKGFPTWLSGKYIRGKLNVGIEINKSDDPDEYSSSYYARSLPTTPLSGNRRNDLRLSEVLNKSNSSSEETIKQASSSSSSLNLSDLGSDSNETPRSSMIDKVSSASTGKNEGLIIRSDSPTSPDTILETKSIIDYARGNLGDENTKVESGKVASILAGLKIGEKPELNPEGGAIRKQKITSKSEVDVKESTGKPIVRIRVGNQSIAYGGKSKKQSHNTEIYSIPKSKEKLAKPALEQEIYKVPSNKTKEKLYVEPKVEPKKEKMRKELVESIYDVPKDYSGKNKEDIYSQPTSNKILVEEIYDVPTGTESKAIVSNDGGLYDIPSNFGRKVLLKLEEHEEPVYASPINLRPRRGVSRSSSDISHRHSKAFSTKYEEKRNSGLIRSNSEVHRRSKTEDNPPPIPKIEGKLVRVRSFNNTDSIGPLTESQRHSLLMRSNSERNDISRPEEALYETPMPSSSASTGEGRPITNRAVLRSRTKSILGRSNSERLSQSESEEKKSKRSIKKLFRKVSFLKK